MKGSHMHIFSRLTFKLVKLLRILFPYGRSQYLSLSRLGELIPALKTLRYSVSIILQGPMATNKIISSKSPDVYGWISETGRILTNFIR